MEYLDVLDKSGAKTGESKPRNLVHRDGDWHRTVHVWIINSRKEILLQKRSQQREKYPNMWHISAAGHVLAGDDSVTAAIKEVKEELGINIEAKDIKLLFSTHKSSSPKPEFIENEFQDVFLIIKDIDIGQITFDTSEVADAKFFPWEEYKMIAKRGDKNFVFPAYLDRLIDAIDGPR